MAKQFEVFLTWLVLCSWRNFILLKQPQYIQVNCEIIVNYGAIQKVYMLWRGRWYSKVYENVKRERGFQRAYTAYIFFKEAFSHLYCVFLFFTSLMRKWKLQHLEKLTLLLNIHQVFYIAFQLIPQDIGITSRNAIWL